MVAEIQNISDVFVRIETLRVLLNVMTVPMALHSIRKWDEFRSIVIEFIMNLKRRRQKLNSSTPQATLVDLSHSVNNVAHCDLSPSLATSRCTVKNLSPASNQRTHRNVIGIFRFTIQCKDVQANVHWLDLTKYKNLIQLFETTDSSTWRKFKRPAAERNVDLLDNGLDVISAAWNSPYKSLNQFLDSFYAYQKMTDFNLSIPSSSNIVITTLSLIDTAICSPTQLARSSLTPILMSSSVDLFFNYDVAAILATEIQLSNLDRFDNIVVAPLANLSLSDEREPQTSCFPAPHEKTKPWGRNYRQCLEQLLLSTVGLHGIIHLDGTNEVLVDELPSGKTDIDVSVVNQQFIQCSLGSWLETMTWDQIKVDHKTRGGNNKKKIISWRGMLQPTVACQFILATSEVVISLTLKINYSTLLSGPSKFNRLNLQPFASLKFLTHAQPLTGHTADLSLDGLLWSIPHRVDTKFQSDKRAKSARESLYSLQFDEKRDRRGHTPLNDIHSLNRRRVKRLNALYPSPKLFSPSVMVDVVNPSTKSVGLLKPLLYARPLSCLIGLALPIFSDITSIRLEVPVVIFNATSVAAQQLALLATNVILNTDFLPSLKTRKRRAILKTPLVSDESHFELLTNVPPDVSCPASTSSPSDSDVEVPTTPEDLMTLSDLVKSGNVPDTATASHSITTTAKPFRFFWRSKQQTRARQDAVSVTGSMASSSIPSLSMISLDTGSMGFSSMMKTSAEVSPRSRRPAADKPSFRPSEKSRIIGKPLSRRRVVSSLRRYFNWEETMHALRRPYQFHVFPEQSSPSWRDEDSPEFRRLPFHADEGSEKSVKLVDSLLEVVDIGLGDEGDVEDFGCGSLSHSVEIGLDYEFQQISISLVKDDCVFCRLSAANLIGMNSIPINEKEVVVLSVYEYIFRIAVFLNVCK